MIENTIGYGGCDYPIMIFLRQASAFIVTYPVNNVIDKEGNETDKAVAWEKAFIQLVKVCSLFHFSECLCNSLLFSSSRQKLYLIVQLEQLLQLCIDWECPSQWYYWLAG